MKHPLATRLLAALIGLAALPTAFAAEDDPASRIEAFVAQALQLGYNPAFAVAVVHGDATIVADAWGRIDVGYREPDETTRFYIASATKSLTGTAAAALVEAGRLDLAAPLSAFTDVRAPEGLPEAQFSIGALLTHTHGLSNDALVIRTAFSGQHDAERLRELVPQSTYVPEAPFDYSNEGYNLFGLALGDLTESADWRGGVRSLVLEPLGMRDTTAYLSAVPAHALALPFSFHPEDGLIRMPLYKSDRTLHAAGGHFMSARDAARWLRANLNNGVIDGERRLPAKVFERAHAPYAESGDEFGEYGRHHYALGWHVGTYDDETLVHHFGSFAGFRSHISFMPDADIGVAVFTNAMGPGFAVVDVVANYAYDLLRGLDDANERGAERLAKISGETESRMAGYAKHLAERAARRSHLTLPIAAYAGRYEHGSLGVLDVEALGDRLLFRLGDATSLAEFYERPEAVRVELPPGSGRVASFVVDDGRPTGLKLNGELWRLAEGP